MNPQSSVVKTEGQQPDPDRTPVPGDASRQQASAQKPVQPPEGHSASMEGASGVPDKIDEGIEPD